MVYYIDSSALLRLLLKSPERIAGFNAWKDSISSQLLAIEAARTLDRLRLQGEITDEELSNLKKQLNIMLQSMTLAAIDDHVTLRAQNAFPTVVRSLDAIHLATLQLWQDEMREPLTLVTHDRQLITAAKALGVKLYETQK